MKIKLFTIKKYETQFISKMNSKKKRRKIQDIDAIYSEKY